MPKQGPPPGAHLTYSRQFRRCKKPGCPSCAAGAGHGPYWYAYWREGSRQRSCYLGKQPPPDAEARSAPVATPPSIPALRVRTLGGLAIRRGATDLAVGSWRPRTATTLFACLVGAPRHQLHRDILVELLWPEGEPGIGRRNLRAAIHHLRRLLGPEGADTNYLRQEGAFLCLVPALEGEPPNQWLDAAAFEQAAAQALAGRDAAACRAALALYGGDYLPEYPTEEWALDRREALRERYLTLLPHLAALAERDGALAEAADCLQRVLAVDPCREAAARALMRVQAADGQHEAAVRTYRTLTLAMRRELDLGPDPETEAQYRAVLEGRLRTSRARGNLPAPATSFVGREAELASLERLLEAPLTEGAGAAPRLVTLTGPGGVGKSRLAIELGQTLVSTYADGAWLVELAALAPSDEADPGPVARQACAALGLREEVGQDAAAALATHLAPRTSLLILDNCEHLVPACATLVTTLLGRCPDLRILATSRETLGMIDEQVWWLASLETPDGQRQAELSLREVIGYTAVRLFVERGRAARHGFALTQGNRRAVTSICAQLDGLPLAIELAATRLGMLSVEDLASRLDDRFRILTGGNRGAVPRHQTLQAVLDWSYQLLDEAEQRLLRALAVFAGGWTLEGAEAIGADPGADVMAVLTSLVGKSLVQAEVVGAGGMRYQLLETIRQYAARWLQAAGEERAARERHLRWYLTLAEEAASALKGAEPGPWLDRLSIEHDNLRAALAWCIGDEEGVTLGLRLAGALCTFWKIRGHWTEGRRWLSTVLAREGGDPYARLLALAGHAGLAESQWDLVEARAAQEERLALARAIGDASSIQTALIGLAIVVAENPAEYARATALAEEGLALARSAGATRNIADALTTLAMVAARQREHRRAVPLLEEALECYRAIGDRIWTAHTQFNLALCFGKLADYQRAYELNTALLPLYEELEDANAVAAVHGQLGRLAFERGDYAEAIAHLQISLRGLWDLGNRGSLVDALEHIGAVAAAWGRPADGVRLLGAADALLRAIGLPADDYEQIVPNLAQVRQLLGDRNYTAALAAGQIMPIEQAVADAEALCRGLSRQSGLRDSMIAASS